MVFASHAFLIFLVSLIGLYWLATGPLRASGRPILIAASIFFYGFWSPPYLLLLGFSILFNYALSSAISGRGDRRDVTLTTAGIAGNLALIAYFKYAMFALETLNWLGGTALEIPEIVLPIGISFYTFQQIGFLVDRKAGRTPHPAFLDYLFFVTFFPQMIAGPIVAPGEMLPQLAARRRWRLRAAPVAVGLALFTIGLAKKAVLIDPFVPYIDIVYDRAATGLPVGMLDGWVAALGYSFQIYFDFSAYSDMALGLALIFGFRLPFNFFSPYKSASIREFWRRWHITLSRFLRQMIYIPLGGNRHGVSRTVAALLATMLLGGLWHGAGWTFVVWGGLHGLFLAVNHLWRHHAGASTAGLLPGWAGRALGVLMTFTAVTCAWVYFRATDMASAHVILGAMFGFGSPNSISEPDSGIVPLFPLYLAIVWLLPNTVQMFRRFPVALHRGDFFDPKRPILLDRWLAFRLSPRFALTTAFVFVLAWFTLSDLNPFIYFQF